ncbi:hypothetical protein K440DRAFT_117352 [Wilcoxina mikolae CBS 423.85]|nr:hypothetical protein K440DRAFT_117352 [Wilcoxina mikolae CBS 423.85]
MPNTPTWLCLSPSSATLVFATVKSRFLCSGLLLLLLHHTTPIRGDPAALHPYRDKAEQAAMVASSRFANRDQHHTSHIKIILGLR